MYCMKYVPNSTPTPWVGVDPSMSRSGACLVKTRLCHSNIAIVAGALCCQFRVDV